MLTCSRIWSEHIGGKTAAPEPPADRRHVSCGFSSSIAVFQIDSELSPHIIMFVSFIDVFGRIRQVGCQGVYAIRCRPFYVKRAFLIELYLTIKTDFAARWCFGFSAKGSSVE